MSIHTYIHVCDGLLWSGPVTLNFFLTFWTLYTSRFWSLFFKMLLLFPLCFFVFSAPFGSLRLRFQAMRQPAMRWLHAARDWYHTTSGARCFFFQKCLDFRILFWDFWGLKNRYVDVGMHWRETWPRQLSVEEVSIGGSCHAAVHGSLVVSSDMSTKRSGFSGVWWCFVWVGGDTNSPQLLTEWSKLVPSSVVPTQRFLFIFTPNPWGNDPSWLAHIFQLGWNSTTN